MATSDVRFGLDAGHVNIAKHILEESGVPLSWISFAKELAEHQTVESYQELQAAFCRSPVPELLCSRGFISLNNPRNTALLKFSLILIATKHSNIDKLQFCKVSHYFFLTSSKEEKDQLGRSHDLLLNAASKFPNVFAVDMDERDIRLKPAVAGQHVDFFKFESESGTSAIHKLKYFLLLCNGTTSLNSAFEFCRCILNKQEKTHLGRNTAVEFIRALESLRTSIYTEGNVITLSPPVNGPRGETPEEVSSTNSTNGTEEDQPEVLSEILDDEDIRRIRNILLFGPSTWEGLIGELGRSCPRDGDIQKFREELHQKHSFDFLFSPDFISLRDLESGALLKLQFVIVVTNKLEKCPTSVSKISFLFNVLAAPEEKESFGRNPELLLPSLKKFPELFRLHSPDDLGECSVSPSSDTIHFKSCFGLEGAHKQSAIYKMIYCINMCGGSCSINTAFEFSRNLLLPEEKCAYGMKMNKESFREDFIKLSDILQVDDDDVELLERYLWTKGDSTTSENEDTHSSEARIEAVKSLLEELEYPLTWFFLENVFSKIGGNETWNKDLIVRDISRIGQNPFTYTEEFISLSTSHFHGVLKLCLIVRMNTIFTGKCGLYDLYHTAKLLLAADERRPFAGDIQSFLKSYPTIFEVVGNPGGTSLHGGIVPGESMVTFADFFRCREHGWEFCLPCQLEYFLNISGGRAQTEIAVQFMQKITSHRALHSSKETKITREEFDMLLYKCESVSSISNGSAIKLRPTTVSVDIRMPQRGRAANRTPTGDSSRSTKPESVIAGEKIPEEMFPKDSSPTLASRDTETHDELADCTASVSDSNSTSSKLSLHGEEECSRNGPPGTSADNTLDSSVVSPTRYLLFTKYERLVLKLTGIRRSKLPVVYLAHDQDTMVILDHSTNGCMFRIPESQMGQIWVEKSPSGFWSLLREFFRDARITFVTLNCEDVARMLRDQLGIQLHSNNVYDMKIALEIISSISCESQLRGLTIPEVCSIVGLPVPDAIYVAIAANHIGYSTENIAMLDDLIQDVTAMAMGLYPWTLQKLEELGGLGKILELTNDKLHIVYSELSEDSMPVTSPIQQVDESDMLSRESCVTTSGSFSQSTAAESKSATSPMPPVSDHGGPDRILEYGQLGSIRPIPPSVELSDSVSCISHPPSIPLLDPSTEHSRSTPSSSSSRSSARGARSVPSNPPSGFPTESSGQESVSSTSAQRNVYPPEPYLPEWARAPPSQMAPHGVTPIFRHMPVSDKVAGLPQGETDDPHFFDQSGYQHKLEQETFCLCKDGNTIMTVPREESGNYDNNLSGSTEDLLRRYSAMNQESIEQLLRVLGNDIAATLSNYLQEHNNMFSLAEIVLDVGRRAEARFHKESWGDIQNVFAASMNLISNNDMHMITNNPSLTGFDEDNRCGIEGNLHSIRGLRNKNQKLIGLTIRIGLPLLGCADMMYDIAQEGKSALIVGYSGVGKTTLLRELARCLSDNEKKRVLVIDTYNEIAGDYDTPHFSIGSARRQQVDSPEIQHKVVKEGAKNHCPEVVIIDLIESAEDAVVATKLAEQGIQVIAGVNMDTVRSVCNYTNFVQIFQATDIAGDETSSLDSAGALIIRYKPALEALVEMKESRCWNIHDLSHTYNSIRENRPYSVQERRCISLSNKGVFSHQILLREKVIDP